MPKCAVIYAVLFMVIYAKIITSVKENICFMAFLWCIIAPLAANRNCQKFVIIIPTLGILKITYYYVTVYQFALWPFHRAIFCSNEDCTGS